jgi:ParB family chromosome partitioning protein
LPEVDAAPAPSLAAEAQAPAKPLVRSGAVGAMGRSLGRIAHAAEEARALIGAGNAVVELDPALIESSFVSDRLEAEGPDHDTLVASIREHGQQVPILVRPHPRRAGHYQIAYGHRRLKALAALKRPVRAVIRQMNDEELVVAQGQENSARQDLSYIERALFAVTLEDRGFDRATIMAALAMEKTQLSRLISIGRAIPRDAIAAIGPAPRTGRPRWAALAQALEGRDVVPVIERLQREASFRTADSDARFTRLEAALREKPAAADLRVWRDEAGRPAATIRRNGQRLALVVDEKIAPEFGEFLVSLLPELHARHRALREQGMAGEQSEAGEGGDSPSRASGKSGGSASRDLSGTNGGRAGKARSGHRGG